MRRRKAPERHVLPDPKYKSELVSKFINGLILKGKKSKAEVIFYSAMDIIENKMKQDPMVVFKKAMDNVAPVLEVRSRRVGGATYQVPVEVREIRRRSLAIRWLVSFSTTSAPRLGSVPSSSNTISTGRPLIPPPSLTSFSAACAVRSYQRP